VAPSGRPLTSGSGAASAGQTLTPDGAALDALRTTDGGRLWTIWQTVLEYQEAIAAAAAWREAEERREAAKVAAWAEAQYQRAVADMRRALGKGD
jgi:hypothetical protein